MIDPITPNNVAFKPVSGRLITVRLIASGIWLLIPAIVLAIISFTSQEMIILIGAGACALVFLWTCWLIPRQVKAIGFATSTDDFLVKKGVMFRQLVAVPYGRIQYVDVKEGPVARKLGIASVQLHTASAHTDTSLDGLPAAEASALRDLLVANGASELSGL